MKTFIIGFVLFVFLACRNKTNVNYKLKMTLLTDWCTETPPGFAATMNQKSSLFEFVKCLPHDFKEDQVEISRSNDTIFASFPQFEKNGKFYSIELEVKRIEGCTAFSFDGLTYTNVFKKKTP